MTALTKSAPGMDAPRTSDADTANPRSGFLADRALEFIGTCRSWPLAWRLGVAVALVLAALTFRLAALHVLEAREPGTYVTLLTAVAVAATVGGLSAGALATTLSALFVHALLAPLRESPDWVSLATFLLSGAIIVVMAEALHVAQTRLTGAAQSKENEDRLRLLIEQAPAALAMFDREMHFLSASARWKADYHVEGNIIGLSNEDVFGGIPERCKEIHRRGLAGECVRADEYALSRPDGSVQWVKWEVRPWYRREGTIGGIIVFSEDITDRKRAEDSLRESEARFRKIFEHAVTGIAITDWAGQFSQANPAYCTLLGYTEDELRRIDFASLIHPDDREENLAEIRRLQAAELPFFQIENRYLRKDGRAVWVHKFVSTLPDDTGRPAHLVALVSDITERKRAEEALRESRARLRTIVDTVVDAIVVINDAGIIQSVNPAVQSIFGHAPDDLVGQSVKVLMPEAYARAHDSHIEAYVRTGIRKIIGAHREVEALHKDGSIFPIDLAVAEWYDATSRRFFTGIMRDISERKRAEEALARARRLEAVGRLAGGIAHDFNNLLSVISGNLELAEPHIEHEKTRQLIRRALEAAQVGGTFNGRLLSIARKRELTPQHLILNGRVSETAKLLEHTLGAHISLVADLAPELWPTCADPGEIDSAILNLAINARDAMPRGGELAITTRNVALDARTARIDPDAHAGDYVRLSIADNGVGMPQEVLQRATEPFFTTKEPGIGTGLGLSSVFDFAKQSGGFVTLASAIGEGTTVSLYLPRAASQPTANAAPDTKDVPRGDGELILVVEDNKRVREIALKRLEALGYAVLEAGTGSEAIQILEADQSIALVFSDIILPGGMTGHDLARSILSTAPQVKVLLTSGYDNAELDRSDPAALANIKLLRKPYTLAQLARCVRETLET